MIPNCSAQDRNILRTWSVSDYCSGEFVLHAQLIRLNDQEAPVLSPLGDTTILTLPNTCGADYFPPMPSATDGCSGIASIDFHWVFGSGFQLYSDVPPGSYEIEYEATDSCGNNTSFTHWLTVEDQEAPVAVCEADLQVHLNGGGVAILFPEVIDDGSYDPCGIASRKLSLDDLVYVDSLILDCSLVSDSLTVFLQVEDHSGNQNRCSQHIALRDTEVPAIACPLPVTISCESDLQNLSLVGMANAWDNCGIDTLYYQDRDSTNSCGLGLVYRDWSVQDIHGNQAFCTQVIERIDTTVLEVIFPSDTSLWSCVIGIDSLAGGTPLIHGLTCKMTSITYTDQVFLDSSGSCAQILRHWEVYDWCQFDPNSLDSLGLYRAIQQIEVRSTMAPLVAPSDTAVILSDSLCEVMISIVDPQWQGCPTQSIRHNSPYASDLMNATGIYPAGTHHIIFEGTDFCGNTFSDTTTLHVIETEAPSVQCIPIANITVQADSTHFIDPSTLVQVAFDNCTADHELYYSISPNGFSCTDIGSQDVTVFVEDMSGNQATCVAEVNVQGSPSCPGVRLIGNVFTEWGSPVDEVDLELAGVVQASVSTDLNGLYESSTLPLSSNWEIRPQRSTNIRDGLSTFDIILMSKHILGIQPFTSPYQIIAADVNGSKTVSTFDIVMLRRLILFISDDLAVPSWQFIDADYAFPNPSQPWQESYPTSIFLESVSEDALNNNFIGIKSGDANGSVVPFHEATDYRSVPIAMQTLDQSIQVGEIIEVPLYLDTTNAIIGLQGMLQWSTDQIELVGVDLEVDQTIFQAEHLGMNQIGEGKLPFSWHHIGTSSSEYDKPLMKLVFKGNVNGSLSQMLQINPEPLKPEAYSPSLQVFPLELDLIKQHHSEPISPIIYPNPTNTEAWIETYGESAGQVTLEWYDLTGRLKLQTELEIEKGPQVTKVEVSTFGNGIWFWQLKDKEKKIGQGKLLIQGQ